jgi:hypothetical protein
MGGSGPIARLRRRVKVQGGSGKEKGRLGSDGSAWRKSFHSGGGYGGRQAEKGEDEVVSWDLSGLQRMHDEDEAMRE